MPTEAEIAYAAGLFEGEGCITFSGKRPNHPGKGARLQLAMSDHDVVERFAAIVGAGTVLVKTSTPAHQKRQWVWCVVKYSEVVRIGEMLRPWMGQRRSQRLDEVLREVGEVEEANCAVCGKTFLPQRRRFYGKTVSRVCSKSCDNRRRRGWYVGRRRPIEGQLNL